MELSDVISSKIDNVMDQDNEYNMEEEHYEQDERDYLTELDLASAHCAELLNAIRKFRHYHPTGGI